MKNSAECNFNIAVALSDMGSLEEAVTHFKAAIELDPQNIDTQISLGTTLNSLKRIEEAK